MTPDPAQDWAWAHESDATAPRAVDPTSVTAILVVHNAEPWLERSLTSLDRLDARPRLVAVDNGSTDASGGLLADALAAGQLDEVLTGSANDGLGAAVARVESRADDQTLWLWLLHDDVEPRADALTQLLRLANERAEQGEPVAIVVPKLLEPRRRNHPNRLSELGQTISRTGDRVLSVEPGDIDQDQLASTEVLGASSAGLLVSRDAWRRLGGMSPELPLFRDGVDLGWRAQRAGLRVVTCPSAAIHHRRAGRNWQRDAALTANPARTDRLLGMRLVAAHAKSPALASLRLALLSLLVAIGHLFGKAPREAADALGSGRDLLASGSATRALRDQLRSAPGSRDVTALRPHRSRMLRLRADQFAGWASDRLLPTWGDDTSIDELTSDSVDIHTRRRPVLIPVAMAALVLLCLVAGRRLFGLGQLAGPALAPAPETLSGAWDAWLRAPHGQWANAPWLAIGALGSTLTLGRPDWFAVLGHLLAVPLATAASLPLWRRLSPPGPPWRRLLLALAWGLAQPLLGITGSGSAGTLLVAIVAPLAACAWVDWRRQTETGPDALRAPARFALWAGIAALAVPALWFAASIAALAAATGRRRVDLRGVSIALLGPLALLAPWGHRLMQQPGRWLTSTDPLLTGPLPWPGEPPWGNTPWWVFIPVAVLLWALASWGVVGRRVGERLWLAAAAGLCWFLGLALGQVEVPLDAATVLLDAKVWLLLATLLLLCLVQFALAGVSSLRHPVAIILLVLLAAQAGWWLVGAGAPTHRSRSALPANITAVQHTNRATRALLVDVGPQPVRWSVTAADQPRWGTAEHAVVPDAAQRTLVREMVATMAAGESSDTLAERARQLGIGHLWLRKARPDVVAAISDSPGLGPAENRGDATSWTVTGLVSRTPDSEWLGPRRWWPAAALALTAGLLLVLAAPSSAGDQGPRRAAAGRGGGAYRPQHRSGGRR
ncbi:glycosyltransferase family 2 protein [Luteococcus sp. H138]|uniref:glycosyltransferase family 2 protein n=1 Tax=unclassified Luteococcus TaxID=2639923 RepID=UPI00313F2E62